MGDGIHFTVLPQDIASHENVTMYSETGAPLPPTRPHGNLKMVTLPQIGVYTTTSTNDPDQDLYYQWAWGNTFRPDPWEFVSGKSGKTITKIHAWKRLNIHDRRENNFYFDIRVRCKNKLGRISNWSEPYSVHVTPNNFKTDWVSPTGNIDNDWTYEENAYDEKPSISSAIYTKINDNDWCDDPLVLTLDEPIHIKGFRIHVTKGLFHDKMKLCFYNGSTHIQTLNYTNWPNLRWKIVDLHRYGYQVDRVEIWFHMNSPLFSRGFFSSPVRVYEFSFWKTDDYG